MNVGEIFGSLSGWKRDTQLIKDEARKGWVVSDNEGLKKKKHTLKSL